MKYTIIKNREQYFDYCNKLEALTSGNKSVTIQDEIELLTFLIEKWDEEHNIFQEVSPIESIKYLMSEHRLKSVELADILGVSKGLVSDILHYKKGLSKDIIRKLSDHFKLSQETFNRPYKLKSALNAQLRNASVMNTKKELKKSI